MTSIVLQIIDLLYIKYESPEPIVIQSTYWMETTRMGFKLSNTTGRKWEVKYMYKYIHTQQFQSKEQGNSRERNMEPENTNQNLITKCPAPRPKRDVAKTTKK